MKRMIDFHLLSWKTSQFRKPLLLRGARQVGKTVAARTLGTHFQHFIEINLETTPQAVAIFEEGNLDPKRILAELTKIIPNKESIWPGRTLLFIDEIQIAPRAITALRYFYEEMPELHVIAAGSLLDFATLQIGIPVGRVEFYQMYPLSFLEFLSACNQTTLIQEIMNHPPDSPFDEQILNKGLSYVSQYLAIGGMPEAIKNFVLSQDPYAAFRVHQSIGRTYEFDFNKYAKKFQIKYLRALFAGIPAQLGTKFNYSTIPGEFRKRDLEPSLELLEMANISYKIKQSACQGIPLGAQAKDHFKPLLLDVALSQALLGLDLGSWLTNPLEQFVNKGNLVEAFIGQEILAYQDPIKSTNLFYWAREKEGSQAEIDYVIQQRETIIPIEVKSGKGSTLKSMHMFLANHTQTPYGLRFSTNNYSVHEKIHSYPLFAVAHAMMEDKRALHALL